MDQFGLQGPIHHILEMLDPKKQLESIVGQDWMGIVKVVERVEVVAWTEMEERGQNLRSFPDLLMWGLNRHYKLRNPLHAMFHLW